MSEVKNEVPPVVDTAQVINTGLNRAFNINIPSQGLLYDGKIPDGVIKARPMTTSEEAILYNSAGDGISKIDAIINACVISREVDPKELLLVDRFYILLILRTQSLGSHYEFPTRCSFCSAQFKASIDIAEDLELKQMGDDTVEPYDVPLPINGDILSLRFLRGTDETRIARKAKRVRMQSSDPSDPSYLYRMAIQIVGINGREVEIIEAEKYVSTLDLGDSSAIRRRTEELECGIDTTIYIDCKQCGATNEMELPFTAEFFRPNTRS